MHPRTFIAAEHARLRALAACVERERNQRRRLVLLAQFSADFEIHRCIVEELLPGVRGAAQSDAQRCPALLDQHERDEWPTISLLDTLPDQELRALGRRLAHRRAELDAWLRHDAEDQTHAA